MAKILGMSMLIFSGCVLLGQIFLYQNTSAYLKYNPLDKNLGMADTGAILPVVFASVFFIFGLILYKGSTEPENH